MVAVLAQLVVGVAFPQAPSEPTLAHLESTRIDQLEHSLESLLKVNLELDERLRELEDQQRALPPSPSEPLSPESSPTGRVRWDDLDLQREDSQQSPTVWRSSPDSQSPPAVSPTADFQVDYDNGFVITPVNESDNPFSLRINNQNMFRFSSFTRDEENWVDSSGNVIPITDSNNFQIPRGRLIFSGNAFSPNLSYLLNIDYNTVSSNPIGFRAYELSYEFSRAAQLHVGQSKVPGSREWLASAFAPLEGPDRSMATTFFRPSLSQGIWLTGEPIEGANYYVMMSNGFNTLNLRPSQLRNRFCWSGSTWWEPWGEFGPGYADLQSHDQPVVRVGGSYTFALGDGSQADSDAVENSAIRLSDGTLITQPGAFAPGVTLQSYSLSLAAIDLAFKYRGMSLSTEWYLRDLFDLEGNGPLPVDSTHATGGFVQGGYFIVPQTLEPYLRASYVTGRYGSGSETASGFNWFPIPGKSNLRFTFDTAWVESSPVSQNRTGFFAGQTGLLIRTQILISF